jgi:hypothetical protein
MGLNGGGVATDSGQSWPFLPLPFETQLTLKKTFLEKKLDLVTKHKIDIRLKIIRKGLFWN